MRRDIFLNSEIILNIYFLNKNRNQKDSICPVNKSDRKKEASVNTTAASAAPLRGPATPRDSSHTPEMLFVDRLDVSMECVTEAADPAARTYSQVLFMDIPHSYPPSAPITCRFTLNAAFRPHSRDWVGIFKVGKLTCIPPHLYCFCKKPRTFFFFFLNY